ncbi:MAG: UbiA-like polyprenyltransferase [Planctomycetota bacterium]|jgi:4-hydroxybenzoate polyprenyltransferase|nr:UbiA-like polyprenyltransferase [Planctomycetota bacterium]MDP6990778.1 UbiA-like polyprenyltransferase [Planctomycetota bacterium]
MRPGELLSLVKFGHSVFALPFALQGAWLASGGVPAPRVLAWVVVCAVAARTAAMAFNRLVDRDVDARNPRTRAREIPAGRVSAPAAAGLVVAAGGVFVAAAWALNPLCGRLSLPVLAVLLGYSLVKRVSFAAHVVLGLSLAIAPLGAWLAVRGGFAGDLAPVLWLAGGVLAWVAGFDLIYACQDASFDRSEGLHSIPARFGIAPALGLSSALHVLALSCFVMQGTSAGLGVAWWAGVVLAGSLLVYEHRIVAPDDLSRVNTAFFTVNGWIGVGLFAGLAIDLALTPGAG